MRQFANLPKVAAQQRLTVSRTCHLRAASPTYPLPDYGTRG